MGYFSAIYAEDLPHRRQGAALPLWRRMVYAMMTYAVKGSLEEILNGREKTKNHPPKKVASVTDCRAWLERQFL